MISARVAYLLYAVLAAIALYTLKGKFLALALIIVGAFAAKTLVEDLRRRTE